MKNKIFIKNLICSIMIFFFLGCGSLLLITHQINSQKSFNYNPIYITFVILFFFGGIGVLLALNDTSVTLYKIKNIKINKTKLFLLIVPSLLISLSYIWLYLGLLNSLISYISEFNYIIVASSIILGYSIASNLDRD